MESFGNEYGATRIVRRRGLCNYISCEDCEEFLTRLSVFTEEVLLSDDKLVLALPFVGSNLSSNKIAIQRLRNFGCETFENP